QRASDPCPAINAVKHFCRQIDSVCHGRQPWPPVSSLFLRSEPLIATGKTLVANPGAPGRGRAATSGTSRHGNLLISRRKILHSVGGRGDSCFAEAPES